MNTVVEMAEWFFDGKVRWKQGGAREMGLVDA